MLDAKQFFNESNSVSTSSKAVIPPATLLSISVGRVAPLFVKEGSNPATQVMSAIRKAPVSSVHHPIAVQVHPMLIEGDEQADLSVHGGLDKAVYMMPVEHYEFWQQQRLEHAKLTDPLTHGFLGENLTVEGLTEHTVYIGDELHIGDVIFAVTAPREPCFKFNAKMGYKHAAKHMVQAGNSGSYLRVVKAGVITTGQAIDVIAGPRRLSVHEQFSRLNKRAAQQGLF